MEQQQPAPAQPGSTVRSGANSCRRNSGDSGYAGCRRSVTAGRRRDPGRNVSMSVMRKKIAEPMVMSKCFSETCVHGIFEVDVTCIVKLRERMKVSLEQATGKKPTDMLFFGVCRRMYLKPSP